MTGFLNDCRHALRLYRRTPGGSLIAVGVLAVGIAFVGAFLSLYVDLVLRPHPGFERSGRVATLGVRIGSEPGTLGYEFVQRISEEVTSIDAVAIWTLAQTLAGTGREPTRPALVSRAFFPDFRPRLALGRGLRAADHEPGAEPVVVLSDRFWREHFNADPAVIDTTLDVARDPDSFAYSGPPGSSIFERFEPEQDSAQFRIVGVTARTLRALPANGGFNTEPPFWLPLERAWPFFRGVPESLSSVSVFTAYVRRAAGASVTAVENDFRTRYERPDSEYLRPGSEFELVDGIVGDFDLHADARRQTELFLAGSVLLALVAAANVSLFLLARAPGRRRELGIRVAVGAPLGRLARQLATEAGLLVLISALLGLVISVWLGAYLSGLALFRDAQWRDITMLDWRVLGLAAAFALVLTLLVSLAPIVRMRHLGIVAATRQTTARASLAQRLAGTLQIMVAGTLGGAAVAFAWHIAVMVFGDPGFEIRDRHFVQSTLRSDSTAGQEAYQVELARWREAMEAIPGVLAVGYGEPIPGAENFGAAPRRRPHPRDPTREVEVYSGYLEPELADLLGLRFVRGRAPESEEVAVNQTLARELWGREDVVGEPMPISSVYIGEGREVVGVLEDFSFGHPADPARPYAFAGGGTFRLAVVRSPMTAAELQQALNRVVLGGGVEMQARSVEPLQALRDELTAPDRARGALTVTTASLVVILAAFGFYGTQRFLVTAGRREYAIRASLGAGPASLGRLVLRRGILMGLPGLAIGGLLAFIVVGYLRGDYVLRDISPGFVTVGVIAGLVSILLAASLGPAREARRTLPAPLLRED